MSLPHSEATSVESEPQLKVIVTPVEQEPATAFNPSWRFYVAFSSLSVITLMAALDATSISVALSIMAKLLKGSAIEAFWAGTSFLLTATVFQPVIGSFSHVFGRKPMIFLSLAFFGVGAIVAAVANNFTVILIGRSIQGIGGGGIEVLTEVLVTDLVPLRERGKWFSFISAMWALGTVCGPLLGGGFSQALSWRWIFWINLPFIAIGIPLLAFFLKLHFTPTSLAHKLLLIDWPGLIVFIAATTGLLIPLTWGGVLYAWTSPHTLIPLLLSLAALALFLLYEARHAPNPLLPTHIFIPRTAALTYTQTLLHGLALWTALYYLPLYYAAAQLYSPLLTATALLPQTLTVAPAATAAGFAIAHTGRYRWALWAGWALTTAGFGALVILDVDTPVPVWVAVNLVAGLGTGVLFPAMGMAVQAASAAEDQAAAVTMFAFVRSLGQAVGVAVGGVVFQNGVRARLEGVPALADRAGQLAKDASGLVEVIKGMAAGEEREVLRAAYVFGLRRVWIVVCALAGLGLVASVFVEGLPLDQALSTEQGFRGEVEVGDEERNEKEAGGMEGKVATTVTTEL